MGQGRDREANLVVHMHDLSEAALRGAAAVAHLEYQHTQILECVCVCLRLVVKGLTRDQQFDRRAVRHTRLSNARAPAYDDGLLIHP